MPNDDKKPARWKRWAAIWIVLLVIGAGVTAYDVMISYPSSPGPGMGQELEVEIVKGTGPVKLSRLLHEKGIISSPGRFKLWLRLNDGVASLKAGMFVLRDDMSPQEIVETLGDRPMHMGTRVTIPEGYNLGQIASALEDAGIVAEENFFLRAWDEKLLAELKVPGKTFEGFLFPDTYFLEKGQSAESVIRRMHGNFERRVAAMGVPNKTDLLELVTMASIVQGEARATDEMTIIAGVYRNRIEGKRFPSRLLQADPTVAYGCEPGLRPSPLAPSCKGFTGKLSRSHLADPANKYNTYRHKGLPPGPICSPGQEALAAALAPADVQYLYFVAGPGGRHRFATTLPQHNANVELYKKGQ